MSPYLRLSLGLSVALHAGLLVSLSAAEPVTFDIERASTSVELVLMRPSAPVLQPEPAVEPDRTPLEPQSEPVPAPEADPAPQTVVVPEQKGAEVHVQPDYLRNPPPLYPKAAQERGEKGTVLVEVEVLASGRCGGIRVLASSGHVALDEAAVRAVRRWVFRPARRFNQPVPFVVEIPITFRLVDAERSGVKGGWR
jgi:protein TonB